MSSSNSDTDSYRNSRRKKHSSKIKGRSTSSSSNDSHYSRRSKQKKRSHRSHSREKYKSKSGHHYSRRSTPDKRSPRERSRSRDKYGRDRLTRRRSRSQSYSKRRSRSSSYSRSRRSHSSDYSRRKSCSPSYSRNRRRSRSTSHHSRRSRSRSLSYREKSNRNRSKSVESVHRRSRSTSRGRTKQSKKSRGRSKSKERNKDRKISPPSSGESEHDKLQSTLKKAIKAAETAGKKLQQQGLLGYDISIADQMNRESLLDEINAPSFLPKAFASSSKSKNSDNAPVIVDLAIPSGKTALPAWNYKPENLLHPNISLESKEDRLNRWVKKLFQIRQRSYNGDSIEYYA